MRKKRQLPRVSAVCGFCQRPFFAWLSNVRRGAGRYCSYACWASTRRGEKHPSWKGGRTEHSAGYWQIWKPEHPRADRKGYVYEHIVVMETIVGRYLTKGEVVHHRDHDRKNNDPGNLELFASHAAHMRTHHAARLTAYTRSPEGRVNLRRRRLTQRFKSSELERLLAAAYTQAGLTFEEQVPLWDAWQVDFVFRDAQLIVEADGEYWHTLPKRMASDRALDKEAEKQGWAVLRLSEKQIREQIDECVRRTKEVVVYA